MPIALLLKFLPFVITTGGSWWAHHRQKKLLKEAARMDTKSGFATTEFWTLLGAVLANFGAAHGFTVESGAIAAGLAGVYTICRTVLKVFAARKK